MANKRKVALVTGGARGIGLAIAKALAKEGCDVALCDVQADGTGAVRELEGLGAKVLYCVCDVGDRAARAKALESVRKEFGRLDVLVNNAGITSPDRGKDLLEMTEEGFERIMRINLQGPYFLMQAAAAWMIEQKKADKDRAPCIVNITSISAQVVSHPRGDYCVSKAGLSMASKVFAARLGEFGIPVYEVQPGVVRTDMTKVVTEKYDRLIGEGLLVQSRWGEPEDVGRAVAMLARGDLAYSSGQVVMVDGGLGVQRL